jgi:hypothetical protein
LIYLLGNRLEIVAVSDDDPRLDEADMVQKNEQVFATAAALTVLHAQHMATDPSPDWKTDKSYWWNRKNRRAG